MLTGGINGFYRFIHQLMKNLRIFINYMTIPLEKAGRSPALLEAARARSPENIVEAPSCFAQPGANFMSGGDAALTIFYRCIDIAA